jgi:hypothetical protein
MEAAALFVCLRDWGLGTGDFRGEEDWLKNPPSSPTLREASYIPLIPPTSPAHSPISILAISRSSRVATEAANHPAIY